MDERDNFVGFGHKIENRIKTPMDREKQEKEVMEYLTCEIPYLFYVRSLDTLKLLVKTIMRRYDLVERED